MTTSPYSSSRQKFEKAAFILKTVAHPLRLAIVDLLTHYDQLNVGEMCEALNSQQPLLSQHLITMKLKGILACHKEGQNVYYTLKEKNMHQLLECIEKHGRG